MKYQLRSRRRRALSLIELLIAIAAISCVAAMAVFSFSDIGWQSRAAKSRANARNICMLYQSARGVGAAFTSTTREGILEELIEGKNGAGAFADSCFRLSLADDEKAAALAYCTFDPEADAMIYCPENDEDRLSAGGVDNEDDGGPPVPKGIPGEKFKLPLVDPSGGRRKAGHPGGERTR